MPNNGDLVKLGTLYVSNTAYAMTSCPVSYSSSIAIKDTVVGKEATWRYCEIGGKKLLIADRSYVNSIAWNSINSAGFVFGTQITIDGQKYLLRLLTGSNGSSGSYGAGCNNEWDKMMDIIGEGDDIWRWNGCYSWCQETHYNESSYRSLRGYSSARYYNDSPASNTHTTRGWRPALEILNTAPLISDSDGDLGNYAKPLIKSYTVAEGDGEKFSILETLDGTTIRSLTNQSDGTFTIDLTSRWGSISKAQHTLKVTATDPQGAASVRTWTFTKTNTPAPAPTINSPSSGKRTGQSFYVEFTPLSDADGDNQYFTAQIATNVAFTAGLQSFSSGLQKLSGGSWVSASYAAAADIGTRFRLPINGLNLNTVRYLRVGSCDTNGSGATAYSAVITVNVGQTLEFSTLPSPKDYMPEYAYTLLNSIIDSAAVKRIFVCNNALDTSPTWEDATSAYSAGGIYHIQNRTKTANQWAVAMKVIVEAGESTGEISVSATGLGVS